MRHQPKDKRPLDVRLIDILQTGGERKLSILAAWAKKAGFSAKEFSDALCAEIAAGHIRRTTAPEPSVELAPGFAMFEVTAGTAAHAGAARVGFGG